MKYREIFDRNIDTLFDTLFGMLNRFETYI